MAATGRHVTAIWAVVLSGMACLAVTNIGQSLASSLLPSRPIVMKLRRTCIGCPNYTITLTSDGRLTYEGGEYTRVRGVHTFRIPPDVVLDMLADFTHPDFFELENVYPSPGVPWITMSLSIEMNDLSKSVLSEDRYGPAVLLALERKMDDLPAMRSLSGWTR
ncbi:MAG: DUF6438 domain-containing protein [Anaerolineae bacterium]|nr:DUF6438 domain-containing protein [Anaerolineae bacterium]